METSCQFKFMDPLVLGKVIGFRKDLGFRKRSCFRKAIASCPSLKDEWHPFSKRNKAIWLFILATLNFQLLLLKKKRKKISTMKMKILCTRREIFPIVFFSYVIKIVDKCLFFFKCAHITPWISWRYKVVCSAITVQSTKYWIMQYARITSIFWMINPI